MNILLNGVGRIGKSILRIALKSPTLKVIAINELNPNIKNIAYNINYDSTYGKIDDKFTVEDNYILNSNCKIQILNENSLLDIDFKSLNIDIIIDASGAKVDVKSLKKIDVKSIFLTHPQKEADINIILGVNEKSLNKNKHKIISTSSCNATALLPLLKIIDDEYEIICGDILTVHPLLNHQKTLDSGCIGSTNRQIDCNFEFGRSATQNIIPSGTTTIEACSYVISNINHDIFSSSSLRVPTSTVGAINVTLNVKKDCSKDKLIELLKEYEKNQNHNIVFNNEEALVSSDFCGDDFTTIVDNRYTQVIKNSMIKIVLWYDNEYGYASKVVDIVKL